MTLDTVTYLLALAARLEGEGSYNNAKLLRAAVDSLLTHLPQLESQGQKIR